ncbi:hypothetical protein SUGI_0835890 [Cryptomeria japonica]|nr:hypothetical protein SUGI_0835890 [Cryptomeria japonica]
MSVNVWKEQEEEMVVKMALDGPIDDYVNATVGGYAQNGYPCGSPSDHGPPMIGDILAVMCQMIAKEDQKTMFMVIRPTESEGSTSRVIVRGVRLVEEQTIADFIYGLEQENLSMLPKVCEIRKTTTLSWHKDHLRSMQSCQDPVMENLGERIPSEMVDLENVMLMRIEGRTWMIAGYDQNRFSYKVLELFEVTEKSIGASDHKGSSVDEGLVFEPPKSGFVPESLVGRR